MDDVLGYKDKVVVITGAATGMGAAAAQLLVDAGALVYAIDIADVRVPVAQSFRVDLRDKAQIDQVVSELPARIDALFPCAGVPHPPFPAQDTVMINFVAWRHLVEALLPRIVDGGAIASIASTAGMAWKSNLERVDQMLSSETFEAAEQWLSEHHDNLGADAYSFSKQCMVVYTMRQAGPLSKRDVRINCIAPSPTESPFMEKLTAVIDRTLVDTAAPANGRYASPIDMGGPLVLLNSKLASFVSGLCLPVDFGYTAEVLTGQRPNYQNIS